MTTSRTFFCHSEESNKFTMMGGTKKFDRHSGRPIFLVRINCSFSNRFYRGPLGIPRLCFAFLSHKNSYRSGVFSNLMFLAKLKKIFSNFPVSNWFTGTTRQKNPSYYHRTNWLFRRSQKSVITHEIMAKVCTNVGWWRRAKKIGF